MSYEDYEDEVLTRKQEKIQRRAQEKAQLKTEPRVRLIIKSKAKRLICGTAAINVASERKEREKSDFEISLSSELVH